MTFTPDRRCDRHAGDPFPTSNCDDCNALNAEPAEDYYPTSCKVHGLLLPCPACAFKNGGTR